LKLLLEEAVRAQAEVEQCIDRIRSLRQERDRTLSELEASKAAGRDVHDSGKRLVALEEQLRQADAAYARSSEGLSTAAQNLEAAMKLLDAQARGRDEQLSRTPAGRDQVDELER
jgi:predicted nuclease with TOPRIM domain